MRQIPAEDDPSLHGQAGGPGPQGRVPPPEILDPSHWALLREAAGPTGTLLDDFLALFFRDEPARVARLRPLAEAQESTQLIATAHTLAGTAAMLGARELQLAAVGLEQAAAAGDWAAVPPRLADALAAWDRLLARLAAEGYRSA